jgi:hypothetical protein
VHPPAGSHPVEQQPQPEPAAEADVSGRLAGADVEAFDSRPQGRAVARVEDARHGRPVRAPRAGLRLAAHELAGRSGDVDHLLVCERQG